LDSVNLSDGQSSRQTSIPRELNSFETRPHPGPLPRREGEVTRATRNFARHNCNHRFFAVCRKTHMTACVVRTADHWRMILPLLGERAGVRAVVTANFPVSRITHHASRN